MAQEQEIYGPGATEMAVQLSENIEEKKITKAALAKAAGISTAQVSQLLSCRYPSNPLRGLEKLEAALENLICREGENFEPPKAVNTALMQLIRQGGTKARRDKSVSIITAAVGTGKTTAIKNAWGYKTPGHTALVESDPTMSTGVFVSAVAKELGVSLKGTIAEKFDRVVDKLKGSQSLLIIDEAETPRPKVLETARLKLDRAQFIAAKKQQSA